MAKKKTREAKRLATIHSRYGPDVFQQWGRKGGNPYLLWLREQKKVNANATTG